MYVLAWQQFLPWRTYSYMYDNNYPGWAIPLAALGSVSFLYMGLMLLAIVLKWTLIGRFKVRVGVRPMQLHFCIDLQCLFLLFLLVVSRERIIFLGEYIF
jgi:hypothetical protein